MNEHNILIDKNKCIGCGICKKVCVAHNIELTDQKATALSNDCIMCGHCWAVCPQEAVSISGYDTEQIVPKSNAMLDPKQVLDVIKFRRSIRSFKNKQIPQEIIEQILQAGRLTHAAKNMQDVAFTVLNSQKNDVEQMAVKFFRRIKPFVNLFSRMARRTKITDNFFFFDAPTVIVIFAKDKTNGLLAAQNMEFVAEANGLGVLYSGFFTIAANSSSKIKKALTQPKGTEVAMTLVIGYPNITYLRNAPREKLKVTYL